MDKTNQKILTISFATISALIAISLSLLLKTFSSIFHVVARINDTDLVRHGLPVVVGLSLFLTLQFNKKVLAWGEDVALEIRKVVWPSRKDTTAMTMVVIVMVFISAIIITFFDVVSGTVVNYLVK